MSNSIRPAFCGILLAGLVTIAGAYSPAANAVELSTEQMVKALQKPVKTRSIFPIQRQTGTRSVRGLVLTAKKATTRQIVVEERKKIAKEVVDNALPSIDLTVPFEYDSAALTAKAVTVLVKLGQALSDQSLNGSTFLVGGHTDARGSDDYNIKLSQRRAQAVRTFLTKSFGIAGDRLVAVGFGELQLKNAANPEADENRRVQLVNVTQ